MQGEQIHDQTSKFLITLEWTFYRFFFRKLKGFLRAPLDTFSRYIQMSKTTLAGIYLLQVNYENTRTIC